MTPLTKLWLLVLVVVAGWTAYLWLRRTAVDLSLGAITLRPHDPHQRRALEAAAWQMSLEAHECDIAEARAREVHDRIIADREVRAEAMNRRWAMDEAGRKTERTVPFKRRA